MSNKQQYESQSDLIKHQDVSSVELLSKDEVYDETDQAQWIQLQEQTSYQERARKANAPEYDPSFDGIHCIDCIDNGIPPEKAVIPQGRLALHKIRCIDCQTQYEKDNKRK